MGLINFAKGEGSQAIQLFGRGVRLKGYNGCLKRSRSLDKGVNVPKHIELLETLTIFGIKAQYMEDFKKYLELEELPTNENVLQTSKGIEEYEKSVFKDTLIAFDFRSHLYAPLISQKENGLKIQISPVSLNEEEKIFVDLLKEYTEQNEGVFANKSLYLLRNKSKVGMGFFEAGNFYPDYVLWIDTDDV